MGVVTSVAETMKLVSPICAGWRWRCKGTAVNTELVEEGELFTISHPLLEK
jgi:hypothetical protein